jgi:hypothetical protein
VIDALQQLNFEGDVVAARTMENVTRDTQN